MSDLGFFKRRRAQPTSTAEGVQSGQTTAAGVIPGHIPKQVEATADTIAKIRAAAQLPPQKARPSRTWAARRTTWTGGDRGLAARVKTSRMREKQVRFANVDDISLNV